MASIIDKLNYLSQIAKERPLTRRDYEIGSSLIYGSCLDRPFSEKKEPMEFKVRKRVNCDLQSFKEGEAELIRQLNQQGISYRDLSDWLDVSKSTISRVVRKRGNYNFASDY